MVKKRKVFNFLNKDSNKIQTRKLNFTRFYFFFNFANLQSIITQSSVKTRATVTIETGVHGVLEASTVGTTLSATVTVKAVSGGGLASTSAECGVAYFDFAFNFLFGPVNVVKNEQKMAQLPLGGGAVVRDLEVDHAVGTTVSGVVEEGVLKTSVSGMINFAVGNSKVVRGMIKSGAGLINRESQVNRFTR